MILVVFKLNIYKSRVNGTLNFNTFLHQQIKIKYLEKKAAFKTWHVFEEMVYCKKYVATIKNLPSIYNMNNNFLIETETVREG